ncbi:MAG: gliding motility-associated C-terminal domain-containing protein [Burkholderiales bacterium]|nr:gliding motility-associated C-terminal domain-containing protein [Bacteroidia bacterium]
MNKLLTVVLFFLFTQLSFAQLADGFDIKEAYQQATNKGISQSDIKGYVEFLHNDYLSHKGVNHAHNSIDRGVYDAGTIYLGGGLINTSLNNPSNPNSPQNAYCPNAGFEQGTFANWTGSYGAVSTGATGSGSPSYTQTSPTIVNPAGNNVSLVNTLNYHTIMTTPATNSVYPNCVGWDSIACKVVGTQTVSEIPVVNPNGGPASVRLNGAMPNYRASKITYNMTLNPNNKNFSVSYALVLYSGGHLPEEQPYFSVKVTDQNGNFVPGCSIYTVTINSSMTNTASSFYDPSWTQSVVGFSPSDVFYRKWSTYAFDFSNYPAITSVNVEFYVGGCSQGGHWGYAYVDAECSQGGAVASFCAGSNQAVLTAPAGYNTYQWIGPSGPVTVANGGNAGTATISPVSAGQVFTCNVTAPNGCASSFQTTVAISTVSITGVGSTPSCPNGNSGTANVSATGSSGGYIYQWVNSSGATVSSAQTATGLAPGIYTINVSAVLCGLSTTTVQVGISAPTFYALPAPFCGSVAWITNAGGSNYKWYTASPLALIAGATSSSLTINSPINGAGYFLVYTTASGCKDSIKYTLAQSPGGSIYASNIKSICSGNNNSYAVINLQTTASPVYNYTVTGPGGYNSVLNNTALIKDSITGLSIGTYSATVFDGQCIYNTTFSVSPFVYTYTLTPPTANICTPGSTTLTVDFGNITPSVCGLSSTGSCSSPNIVQIGTGTQVNSNTSYPAIYGNFYKNTRHQILYRASELSAAGVLPGKISSIAFNITTIDGITSYPNFTIKMKCTSVADLTSTTFDNTSLTQVYFASSINITTGWNTYNFPTAYEWDGVSNILIDVCDDLTTNYTYNSSSPYTITSFNSVRWFNSDGIVACMTTNPSNNYTPNSTYRPNIKFGNCGGSNPSAFNYTWTPTTGLNPTNTYTTIASPSITTVYTVQVNPIGQTNCMQAQSSTVSVVVPVTATVTPVNPMCTNASTVSLSALPSGGNWAGSGVSSTGVLTPSLATPGNNTYTYSIGSGTCSSMGNTTISIEKYVPSTISGTITPLCLPSNTINLSIALTTSTLGAGAWSGNGVTGTTFNPVTAGVGTHTLTYSTNSSPTPSLCPSFSTTAITVNSTAQPTITSSGPFCTNASSLSIISTPTGGTWSGNGISATGVLTPSLAVVGNNTYTYTVGSSTCSASNTTTVSIEKYVPSTITGNINTLCITNPSINLSTALTTSTLGVGTWSGNGISGTTLDPATAGAGTHTFTYTTNSSPTTTLCPSSSTINVTVNSVAQPTIASAGPFCDNYPAQQLTVAPFGGVWSTATVGTTISSSGSFVPGSSIIGNNKIYYALTNAPCVKKDSINVTVIKFIPATITGALGPYCIYDPAVNLQPTAQFAGGVWSGPGVTGSSFSPTAAGAGNQTIFYNTDPAPTGLCPDTKTLSILVNPKPNANAFPNVNSGCVPLSIDYSTSTVNSGTAIWVFGDSTPNDTGLVVTHIYSIPGTYTATLYYTENGCKDTTVSNSDITVHDLPIASFDPSVTETTVIDGQVEFTNHSTVLNNNTYTWDIGGQHTSTLTDESYLFLNSGNFVVTLTATTIYGCIDDTSVVIKVNPDVVIYVPNAFTPGADGLNDVFQVFIPPSGADYSTYNITIYDRWGELIFKSSDITDSWTGAKNNSGEILKQDVYVWKISFRDEKKKHYEKIGHVSLLRK